MTTVYELTQETRVCDGIQYTAYGIAARTSDNRILVMIQDITMDRLQAEKFVELCNSKNLSPEHLADAVADFVAA